MSEIKAGDLVRLKSGGPRMTVESVEVEFEEKKASCTWFYEENRYNASFRVVALEIDE